MDYEYRGYKISDVMVDDENELICGQVFLDRDVVAFESSTPSGFFCEFRVAVDHYLASCESRGVKPEPPPSQSTVETAVADPNAAAKQLVRGLMTDLKERRTDLGFSLTGISEATGMDRSAVVKLENGPDQNPTICTLVRYASSLGVALEIRPKVRGTKPKSARTKKGLAAS